MMNLSTVVYNSRNNNLHNDVAQAIAHPETERYPKKVRVHKGNKGYCTYGTSHKRVTVST